MCSSLRGPLNPSTQTPQPQHRHRSSLQTSQLHRRHYSTTQASQHHRRHRTPNADTVLAMIGGQVGLFPEDRKQACHFNQEKPQESRRQDS
jgi:hypothetical protein